MEKFPQVGKKYKKLSFSGISTSYIDTVKVMAVTDFGNGKKVVTYRVYYLPFLWIDNHMELSEFVKSIERL